MTVGCANSGHDQGNQTTDESNKGRGDDLTGDGSGDFAGYQIPDCVSCQGKTNDGNGGTDNDGRHQLVDPGNADKLNDQRDDNVNQTCDNRTENESEASKGHGYTACERGAHRTEKCEGRAEKYGAPELGEEQVNESTDAGTEECGGRGHTVSDDDRDDQCRRHNGEQLLNGKDDQLVELRFVVDIVDELHV